MGRRLWFELRLGDEDMGNKAGEKLFSLKLCQNGHIQSWTYLYS